MYCTNKENNLGPEAFGADNDKKRGGGDSLNRKEQHNSLYR